MARHRRLAILAAGPHRLLAILAVALLAGSLAAGCGSSVTSTSTSTSTAHHSGSSTIAIPRTPVGRQLSWLLGATAQLPISGQQPAAHFDSAFLTKISAARLSSVLAALPGGPRMTLTALTTATPAALTGVVKLCQTSLEVAIGVDAGGLIDSLTYKPDRALLRTSSGAVAPIPSGWADQPVSFTSAGTTIYGSYLHPAGRRAPLPAAVIIAGSGPTDRNGNSPLETGRSNTLRALAGWLADDGVASLRYDKLGSGQTGLGSHAARPGAIGIGAYEQEAAAALRFLARQPGVNPSRLAAFGHSEGALFALLLAGGDAGAVPRLHALGLLEGLSRRALDVLDEQVRSRVAGARRAGLVTTPQAAEVRRRLAELIDSLRSTGKVPAGLSLTGAVSPAALATPLFSQLSAFFSPATGVLSSEEDRYDPARLGAKLHANLPVLVTCSGADTKVSCGDVDHLAIGLSKARVNLDFVHFSGVDHDLMQIPANPGAAAPATLPFSTRLQDGLRAFVRQGL